MKDGNDRKKNRIPPCKNIKVQYKKILFIETEKRCHVIRLGYQINLLPMPIKTF
jgi:hypothetical protein